MNIFILDNDPVKAAQMYCNRHILKMIIELAQLLSAAHHAHDTKFVDKVYKKTHWNHPCTKWVRQTSANYDWAYKHFIELLNQYTLRYGKIHATSRLVEYLQYNPNKLSNLTPFAQAMPDKYKNKNPVKAYRNYYNGEKLHFAKWKVVNKPNWVN